MFTGLIRHSSTLVSCKKQRDGSYELVVSSSYKKGKRGDSIAVNGCCLTVLKASNGSYSFEMVPETMLRTTFVDAKKGQSLNIEPALKVGERLDGHFVSGHVDTTGQVTKIEPSYMHFSLPVEIAKFVAHKGSITINGVSLTVASLSKKIFSVALITETKEKTNLGKLSVGDSVHIEVDLLARYIDRLITKNI